MFLFSFFGPEIIIVLIVLGVFIFGIIMVIKLLKRLFSKKTGKANSTSDKIGQLERLAALKQKGLLTDVEYQKEKINYFKYTVLFDYLLKPW